MLVKNAVLKTCVGIGLLSATQLAFASDGIALKYNVEGATAPGSAWIQISVYQDGSGIVDKYCKPVKGASSVSSKTIKHDDSKVGSLPLSSDWGSVCIVVLQTNTHASPSTTPYYYGPYKTDPTCNVNSREDIAAFELKRSDLTLGAKIGGFVDREGNVEGDIDNCIPTVNWNDKIQRVSIKPTPKSIEPPRVKIYEKGSSRTCGNNTGRGTLIYENRLLQEESLSEPGAYNYDLHFGVYVTDGQSNNPFCVEIRKGGAATKAIYKGPYAVDWDNTCELKPVIENGKMIDLEATDGCTSGPIN